MNSPLGPTFDGAMERTKGFEPSTPTLARWCSTTELRPRAKGSVPGGIRGRKKSGSDVGKAAEEWGIRKKKTGGSVADWYNTVRCSFAANSIWALSSGGEHFLDAEGVRGSNPLAPTMKDRASAKMPGPFILRGHAPDAGPALRYPVPMTTILLSTFALVFVAELGDKT